MPASQVPCSLLQPPSRQSHQTATHRHFLLLVPKQRRRLQKRCATASTAQASPLSRRGRFLRTAAPDTRGTSKHKKTSAVSKPMEAHPRSDGIRRVCSLALAGHPEHRGNSLPDRNLCNHLSFYARSVIRLNVIRPHGTLIARVGAALEASATHEACRQSTQAKLT